MSTLSASAQLTLPSSQRVTAATRYGTVTGGRLENGVQAFLNVPYGVKVPRWSDPQALPEDYKYPSGLFTGGKVSAQPIERLEDGPVAGEQTETPFFVDIYTPSTCTATSALPVRVFIHGGALQHGSTLENGNDEQWARAEALGEIRVMIAYRLSVFGFLACDEPQFTGNYGFKDCWLALEWIRNNIAAFGGDPEHVHLSGLSAGAHTVHQLLHRAASEAPKKAPFIVATLHSNALIASAVDPATKRHQFGVLCGNLGINPASPDVLTQLRAVSADRLIEVVQSMGDLSTFRGVCGADGFIPKGQMEIQRSGILARGLKNAGVKCIVVGEVKDEIAFYGTQHPSEKVEDILPNLIRYYPEAHCKRFMQPFASRLDSSPNVEEINDIQGTILANAQSHLPIRFLYEDFTSQGLPVIRYSVELALRSSKLYPKVTHGSDVPIHHLRLSKLTPGETDAARAFIAELEAATEDALNGGEGWKERKWLVLGADGKSEWKEDRRWSDWAEKANSFRA